MTPNGVDFFFFCLFLFFSLSGPLQAVFHPPKALHSVPFKSPRRVYASMWGHIHPGGVSCRVFVGAFKLPCREVNRLAIIVSFSKALTSIAARIE